MRLSPFGLNPPAFFMAVTLLGPQRISNPTDPGELLVVAKVQNRPHTYVCLPDDTYVPVLLGFGTTAQQPLTVDPIRDQLEEPLTLLRARPYNLGDLIQRLAEYAISHTLNVTSMVAPAVHLWFNAGLIERPTAAVDLARVYRQNHLNMEWVVERLANVELTDDAQLRSLAVRVVDDIAKKLIHDYTQQI